MLEFDSNMKYSHPTFMGLKMARLWLTVVSAHKGILLIFYYIKHLMLLFLSIRQSSTPDNLQEFAAEAVAVNRMVSEANAMSDNTHGSRPRINILGLSPPSKSGLAKRRAKLHEEQLSHQVFEKKIMNELTE